MSRLTKTDVDVVCSVGSENHPGVGILHVESHDTYFSCLALDVNGTTYYYWPDTSGGLRYGTNKPTVATQDSAGSAV